MSGQPTPEDYDWAKWGLNNPPVEAEPSRESDAVALARALLVIEGDLNREREDIAALHEKVKYLTAIAYDLAGYEKSPEGGYAKAQGRE